MLIYVHPRLPSPVHPRGLPWHKDSLGRCLLASPSGPQWVTLTESQAKKIQCLPPSGPILSPQQQTASLRSKLNLVARSYGNTSQYEKLDCLSRSLWIKPAIDHLKALAILHMQRTLCPSPVQPEHKTLKTLYVKINQTQQDTSTVGTPAAFTLLVFSVVHWLNVMTSMAKLMNEKLSLYMHKAV